MMKKIQSFLLLLFFLFGLSNAFAQTVSPPPIAARSWLLLDVVSDQVLASHDAHARIEPASLTKLMSAYVIFNAIKEKHIQLNNVTTPSDRIWKENQRGKKMFITPHTPIKIQDLLYGMIVLSANDATMALVDAIAGSEKTFVSLMNQVAKRIGMKSTHFSNPYGYADKENYSTAYDLSILANHLVQDFPELYKTYSIREFTHNRIHQSNRNRLLWLDPTIDGIETGHTSTGEYSFITSSVRYGITGERRLIAIIIGADSTLARAQDSLKLLNWGYENFDTVKLFNQNQEIAVLDVWKGSNNKLSIGFNFDAYISVPKGSASNLISRIEHNEPLVAPILKNTQVGTLKIILDNQVITELPVVALENVSVASILGRISDTIKLWFK